MKDIDAIRVKAANAVTALADLNATLAASYQNEVHALRETVELQGKELARLNHANGEQGKELCVLREANHSLARNCAEESNRASALQAELNSVSSELKIKGEYEIGLKQLIIDIRREAGEAKEQLAEAETKNRELSAELAKAGEALAKYDGQSEFHKWTNGDFAKQIADVRADRDALREANEAHKKQIDDLIEQRTCLRNEIVGLKETGSAMESRVVSLERDCDVFRQKAETYYAETKADLDSKYRYIVQLESQLDACVKKYTAAKDEITALKGVIETQASEIAMLEEACSLLEGKILKHEGGP